MSLITSLIDNISKVIVGIILIGLSFGVLLTSEGCSNDKIKSLKEINEAVISTSSSPISQDNEGKLVHITGFAKTDDIAVDSTFKVSAKALKLERIVEMYQWVEKPDSKPNDKRYSKRWSKIDNKVSTLDRPNQYKNPSPLFLPKTFVAKNITLGSFKLSRSLINQINNYSYDSLYTGKGLPEVKNKKVYIKGKTIYISTNHNSPELGDLKIKFRHIPETEVSIISKQEGRSFKKFVSKSGSYIELVKAGNHTAETMLQSEGKSASIIKWLFRLGCIFIMTLGIFLILKLLINLINIPSFAALLLSFFASSIISISTIIYMSTS